MNSSEGHRHELMFKVFLIYCPNRALTSSMFASDGAARILFLTPMQRPGIELLPVKLHLFLRNLNPGRLTYSATAAEAKLIPRSVSQIYLIS